MTTFDDRKKSYEAKFVHDEQLRFRATARRDKYLAAWAAAELGLSAQEAGNCVRRVMSEKIANPGEDHTLKIIERDLKAKGLCYEEWEIRVKLVEFTAQAMSEV